jgi:hypothetical protein
MPLIRQTYNLCIVQLLIFAQSPESAWFSKIRLRIVGENFLVFFQMVNLFPPQCANLCVLSALLPSQHPPNVAENRLFCSRLHCTCPDTIDPPSRPTTLAQ